MYMTCLLYTSTDRHLRLQAEFDNFRKRTIRERAELIKFGGESVILDILPVIDDFERAIQSLELLPEDDPGKQGTVLIYSKLIKLLKQHQVEEIANGTEKKIKVKKYIQCQQCNGTGAKNGTAYSTCSTCHGSCLLYTSRCV